MPRWPCVVVFFNLQIHKFTAEEQRWLSAFTIHKLSAAPNCECKPHRRCNLRYNMHEPRSEIHAGRRSRCAGKPPPLPPPPLLPRAITPTSLREQQQQHREHAVIIERDEDAPEFPAIIGETTSTSEFYDNHPPEARAARRFTANGS